MPFKPYSRRASVRALATARFISLAGTDATAVAVGFALYAQTGSAQMLSISLVLTLGSGVIIAPLAGRAGDLLDQRRLMVGCELAAAALLIGLAFLHSPLALLAFGVIASGIGTVFGPASGAAIAQIAGPAHLNWANGVIATGANVGKTAGRLAAGALLALVGAAGVFLLDALLSLVSAWLIRSVRRAFKEPLTAPAPEAVAASPPGGLRFVVGHRKLKLVLASACVSTFATAFSMTAEVPLVFEIGAGPLALGALTACWGGGMVLGSWAGSRLLHDGNEATGVLVGRLAMAAGIGLMASASALGPMFACYLLGGAGGGFMAVAAQSLILRNTPDEMRARVLSAIEACRNVAFGLGVVGAGTLVSLLGARPVYGLVGAVLALGTLPVASLVYQLGGPRSLRPARA